VIEPLIGRGRIVRISERILAFGCRRRSPLLVAAAWALATGPLEITRAPDDPEPLRRRRSRVRARSVVVLHKAGGTEDMLAAAASRHDEDGLRLALLPRDQVRAVFETVLGEPAFPTLTDTDYRPEDPQVQPDKLRYRAFLIDVVRWYARLLRVAGMTTANLSFRAERELAAACSEAGLPFLALHKESIRTPEQRSWFTRAYEELIGPFEGRAIAVYNADERASIVASGLAASADVAVVGCPRMDVLHRQRTDRDLRERSEDAPVILFAIDVHAGTWTPYDDRQEVGAPVWTELARATEVAFLASARRHPERKFVLKAKIGREQQQLGRLPAGVPTNVEIIAGGIGTDLIRHAGVVIGFNSTVLLEAIASGVPTLMPRFAEASEPGAERWIFDLGGAVTAVADPERLADAIDAALAEGPTRELSPEAVAALERYVGNADGGAGARAWAFLRESLG